MLRFFSAARIPHVSVVVPEPLWAAAMTILGIFCKKADIVFCTF
jgi:hypothetical protein